MRLEPGREMDRAHESEALDFVSPWMFEGFPDFQVLALPTLAKEGDGSHGTSHLNHRQG